MLRSGFPLHFYPDATIGVYASLQLAVILEAVARGVVLDSKNVVLRYENSTFLFVSLQKETKKSDKTMLPPALPLLKPTRQSKPK